MQGTSPGPSDWRHVLLQDGDSEKESGRGQKNAQLHTLNQIPAASSPRVD